MCGVQILAASHAPVHAFPCCFLNLSNDTEISRRQCVHKIVTSVRCYITQCCKLGLLARPKDGISALISFLIVLFEVYQPGGRPRA